MDVKLSDPRIPHYHLVGERVREMLDREATYTGNSKARIVMIELRIAYIKAYGEDVTQAEFNKAVRFSCPDLSVQSKYCPARGYSPQTLIRYKWRKQ